MAGDKCKKAVSAASQILSEETCQEGEFVEIEEIGNGMLVWIPEGSLEHSPHSPENEEELESAIEACMKGEWAEGLAKGMLGPGASEEARKKLKRKVCRGLY